MAKRHKGTPRRKKNRRSASARGPTPPQPIAPPPPTSFTHQYGTGVLSAYGPLILAVWSAPGALRDALQRAGTPIPADVGGALLLDTGATTTCISIKAAQALGLKATRMAAGLGSGGRTNNPMFLARLSIAIAAGGMGTVITWEKEVQGIPDLEKALQHGGVSGALYAGAPRELIGLLGRDLLAGTRFFYDGLQGNIEVEFDLAAMGAVQIPAPTPGGGSTPPETKS